MRKLRKIRLHQEGTRQLTVGLFVWLLTNALVYYFTYTHPDLRWVFILYALSIFAGEAAGRAAEEVD